MSTATPTAPVPKVDPAIPVPPPGADGEVPPVEERPHGGFWADPRVASMTGMVTSILLHAVLIIAGLLFVPQVQDQLKKLVNAEEQTVIPVSELATDSPGGIPNPGMNTDTSRAAAQNTDSSVNQSDSWAESKSENLSETLSGSASSDASASAIALGGGKTGAGQMGSSFGGGGKLAKFGAPGGGSGIGPKGAVFGSGGNAYNIVFVVDGTGTMLGTKYNLLTRELVKTVGSLKPMQNFNVIIFKDGSNYAALDKKALIPATSANKQRLSKFLEETSIGGATDVLPALELAFTLRPQLLYLLSDGAFNDLSSYDAVIKKVNELNAEKKTKVNTIMLRNDTEARNKLEEIAELKKADEALRKIAKDSNGVFVSVDQQAFLGQ
jgi:hypothetical protein